MLPNPKSVNPKIEGVTDLPSFASQGGNDVSVSHGAQAGEAAAQLGDSSGRAQPGSAAAAPHKPLTHPWARASVST